MKKLLIFLHLFVGIGALFGGGGAIINPLDPMGISVDVLHTIYFMIGGIEILLSLRLIGNRRNIY
ncbi:hypothetical protein DFR79_1405 [Halanaerobium saccharolyticum]|uniref:Uncharacterized protein n=1 Tax=Halanaerobium saccharolyticum TaxID=43595 RepID=A0A4R6LDS2_9FIRM|nr:hypothetical protein [Halanaerobium saccharolyticum]TDO73040.1 hypothetical protein DFR79_1405 [Halanaerobium saccharolyticum]